MESPFDVLQIDAGADDETVEEAYRRRVMEAHPDQGGSIAEFRAVRTAYETLQAGYDPDAEPESGDRDSAARQQRARSTVTYLNYDVLGDFGWQVDDADLFEKAAASDLDRVDYGEFEVDPGETLLEGAETAGYAWPFACRGGACANCAVMLVDGELSMPVNHVLPAEMMERNIRLCCNGMPITDELKVVYNLKHMPELEDLLLPPRPFEQAHPND
ncbi:ferredoxin Fer [Haloarculaceae archaeon H-GB2-1]|nr:ferredoxin Fer [Haloarculaceae archaeon H-GB1-1]MEA5406560.1 ferredoxin Fer [Haloarculaceae archaeon H-GB2-1]